MKYTLMTVGRLLMEHGICIGAGGNMSIRHLTTMKISPTGEALYETADDDYAEMDLNSGRTVSPEHIPSSEWRVHRHIYNRRPDVRAVIHTHAPAITGLVSVKGASFQPLLAETVADAGRITELPYLTSGSTSLADAVYEACLHSETMLLRNHGMINMGTSLKQAYFRCCVMEMAARTALAALAAGEPDYLSNETIQAIQAEPLADREKRMADNDTC